METVYQVATVERGRKAEIAQRVAAENLNREQTRRLAKEAKRDGNAHRSGRTGRKVAKKPFTLK